MATLKEMLAPQELHRLLELGEIQLARVAAALESAWHAHGSREALREAHKLVGLAGSLGCSAVLAAARNIEASTAAAADASRTQALIDDLRRLLPKAVDALRRWRLPLAGRSP